MVTMCQGRGSESSETGVIPRLEPVLGKSCFLWRRRQVSFSEDEPLVVRNRLRGDFTSARGTHWPQLKRKITELKDASNTMVFFLNTCPRRWALGAQKFGRRKRANVFADVVEQLIQATAWMRTRGFPHFDVHPGNVLVQDGRLLFTEERTSMFTHEEDDRVTGLMHLFHWTLFEVGATSGQQRLALLRAAAADPATSGCLESVLVRHEHRTP